MWPDNIVARGLGFFHKEREVMVLKVSLKEGTLKGILGIFKARTGKCRVKDTEVWETRARGIELNDRKPRVGRGWAYGGRGGSVRGSCLE